MRRYLIIAVMVLVPSALAPRVLARPKTARISGLPVASVPAGKWTPMFRITSKAKSASVSAFWLMERPVTNADFLAFVSAHPEYRRGSLAPVFADERYLAHWQDVLTLGPAARPNQPVTHVSWFAASAFCEAHGMRLPTEAEWELAAAASSARKDGRNDAELRRALLDWYTTPSAALPDVPHGPANYYGVRDLHGVIWEWVDDFNNAVVVADSRNPNESADSRFCGAGAVTAQDTLDYAAFMRVAMRGALEAPYTGTQLGFRCAADGTVQPESRP
jgi:formylglycine-generating enzyme required for sulfatase activity